MLCDCVTWGGFDRVAAISDKIETDRNKIATRVSQEAYIYIS